MSHAGPAGGGGALGTAVAGSIADRFGDVSAFLAMATCLALWLALLDTGERQR